MVLHKWFNNRIMSYFSSNSPSSKTKDFYFPDDIWIEILSRVPADRLQEFKRVCKHWRVLISSHDFCKSHLKKAQEKVILVNENQHTSILKVSRQVTRLCDVQNMGGNLEQSGASAAVCSCDGLLLFLTQSEGKILIVNPITQETRVITSPNKTWIKPNISIFFDRFEDDYKLLYLPSRLIFCKFTDYIYSFKRAEWSKLISVQAHKYFVHSDYDSTVVVADSIHLIRCFGSSCSQMVLVFKIENNDFSFIPYPNGIDTEIVIKTNCCLSLQPDNPPRPAELMLLIEKDGQLGLCHTIGKRKVIEIWVLQEYGNWESWARKYVVDLSAGISLSPIRIASFKNDGDFLIVRTLKGWYSYDLERKKTKQIWGLYPKTPLTLTLVSPNNVYTTL